MRHTIGTVSLLLLVALLGLSCGEDPERHRYAEHWSEVDSEADGGQVADEGAAWDGFCGRSSQERECDLVGSCRMAARLRECYRTELVGEEHICRFENPQHSDDGMPCITIAECLTGWTATGRGPEEVADLCDPDFVFVQPATWD
ncbi:MAG: hypothetical protein WCS84_01495 [Nocardioides sp.]|jgi:hypothetical protein